MNLSILFRFIFAWATVLLLQPLCAQSFNNPVPVPPLLDAAGGVFNLNIQTASHNFNPNQTAPILLLANTSKSGHTKTYNSIKLNVAVPAYCYNAAGSAAMTYLGPTLRWWKGDYLLPNIKNTLPEPTTVHWHGLNLPGEMDGGPHEIIEPGKFWRPAFPLIDAVQTCWYHSHLMDSTTEQVIKGVAGMIILEDTVNDPVLNTVPHSYGANDFPIVIQEKRFVYDTTSTDTVISGADTTITIRQTATGMYISNKPGNGNFTLINGVFNGYLHVPQQVVRLRMLNGSPRKTFIMALSDQLASTTGSLQSMSLMATDGGYTAQPYPMDSAYLAPGERMEFLVDFGQYANGDTLYLANRNQYLPSDYIGSGPERAATLPLTAYMAFVVDNSIQPADSITSIPSTLGTYVVDTTNVFRHRLKRLMVTPASPPGNGAGGPWTINGDTMNMNVINDYVRVNSKEHWTIRNNTGIAHPFHIHKVQFQVVKYIVPTDTYDPVQKQVIADTSKKDTFLYTDADFPEYLRGYKDDVIVRGGGTMEFVASFDSFPANPNHTGGLLHEAFMYHCHILPHEDFSMMQQFVVVDSATYEAILLGNESTAGNPFRMYPNPASHTLTCKGTSAVPGVLRFMDVTGRLLHEVSLSPFEGETSLSVASLPRGLVLVEWVSAEGRFTRKLLLE